MRSLHLFFDAVWSVQAIHSFHLLAYAIFPDHFHWLLHLEEGQASVSDILKRIKEKSTTNYKLRREISSPMRLWQERFREHLIRDETDLEAHFDYIHWNPVKHGYVHRPEDWPHSTYLHWSGLAYYPPDWGWEGEPANIRGMDCE